MTEIEDMSKAVAEASKFGTTSVEATQKMLGFLSKILGYPLNEASGIIGDKLSYIRWQRQERMVDEVNTILIKKGLSETKSIPPKFAIPMLEQAALEEDDSLQDLWNKLIANSLDPDFNAEIRYSYIEIIKSLNVIDVKILTVFYNTLKKDHINISQITDRNATKEDIARIVGVPIDECTKSIYNLFRVQCLAPAILKGGIAIGSEPITIFKGADIVTMTPLGFSFAEACIETNEE